MQTIQIPFNYSPRQYQLEYLSAPQRFKIVVWHRRSGKSKSLLNEQIRKTQEKKGIYYYFLPTYRNAKAIIWDELIKLHVPMELVSKINESELSIYWKNGSIQRFVGTEDYNKHRGINPIDVVFDEYSEQDERIWTEIIQPVLRENHGTASFGFTPKGKNHSWQLLQQAKLNPDDWFWSVKGIYETKVFSEKEVDAAKKSTPQALFEQEYLCSFLDDAGSYFRRVRENAANTFDSPNPMHTYQLGVDLAKYNDWTVITPFNLNTFQVGKQERFNQVDWNLQKARIEAMARRYNNAKVVIDSTGVGDPIVEDLERNGLNIESFKFSVQSKRKLLDNLSILLEQDKIKLPMDEELFIELESQQLELSDSGKLITKTPKNMTDDRVMSLALAVYETGEPMKQTTQNYNLYNTDYS